MESPVPGSEDHKILSLIENVAKKVCLFDKKYSRNFQSKNEAWNEICEIMKEMGYNTITVDEIQTKRTSIRDGFVRADRKNINYKYKKQLFFLQPHIGHVDKNKSGVKRPIKSNEDSSNISSCSSYNTVISTQSLADPPAVSSRELFHELKTELKQNSEQTITSVLDNGNNTLPYEDGDINGGKMEEFIKDNDKKRIAQNHCDDHQLQEKLQKHHDNTVPTNNNTFVSQKLINSENSHENQQDQQQHLDSSNNESKKKKSSIKIREVQVLLDRIELDKFKEKETQKAETSTTSILAKLPVKRKVQIVTTNLPSKKSTDFNNIVTRNYQNQEGHLRTGNIERDIHPPQDNFARRNKRSIDQCELKFEEAVNTFEKFTKVATNYYAKKQNLLLNNHNVQSQSAVSSVSQPTFKDGYEEEMINLFRKIPKSMKKQAFGYVMEQMECVMHDAGIPY